MHIYIIEKNRNKTEEKIYNVNIVRMMTTPDNEEIFKEKNIETRRKEINPPKKFH